MEVLRYRKKGLTQKQIADIFHTSKSNVCTIEKNAQENIRYAKETLDFLHTLDARYLCTLKAGSDLFDSAPLIKGEAAKNGIPVTTEMIDLINRLRVEYPTGIRGRLIMEDIKVFLRNDGELYFG
jgi:hypothetical protein